mmetsp:Transcript_25992/g.29738  ORF Transcript_25992/g.29738 Transcript_25992/m.29738 type:complete len:236 (-) Transcript_25992:119-826(-)
MGIFDKVKNAAEKIKLQGEITLLNHNVKTRKKEFGIEFWDLLLAIEKKRKQNPSTLRLPGGVFQKIETSITEHLEQCRKDMNLIEGERLEYEQELTKVEVRKDKVVTSSIGSFVTNAGSEANFKLRIVKSERDGKIRKEKFGIDIWDIVVASTSSEHEQRPSLDAADKKKSVKSVLGNMKGAIRKGVKDGMENVTSKLSKDEAGVQECIQKAKDNVTYIERSIERKKSIIESIGK